MLRKHFIMSGLEKPDYIITYYASEKVPFVGGYATKNLTMTNGENELNFKVVSDTYSDGVGTWGLKFDTSNNTVYYGNIVNTEGLDGYADYGGVEYDYSGLVTDLIFSEGVTEITNLLCFNNESLENITLPNTLLVLGKNVLNTSSITTLTLPLNIQLVSANSLPKNLQTLFIKAPTPPILENNYFINNPSDLLSIYVYFPTYYAEASNWNKLKLYTRPYPNVLVFESKLSTVPSLLSNYVRERFSLNSLWYTVIDTTNITNISRGTFSKSLVTNITWPVSVTCIKEEMFYQCKSLLHVYLPYGLQEIQTQAFDTTPQLAYIEIPNSLKTMGYSLFYRHNNPLTINYLGSIEEWLLISRALSAFGETIGTDYTLLFNGENIETLTIEQNNINVPNGTFHSCINIKTLNISVPINIGEYSFCNSGLLKLSITDNVVCEEYAFAGSNLTEVTLMNMDTISNYLFKNCVSLETVECPDVISIGQLAFENCSSLTNINLEGVASIGDYAFNKCTSLTNINLNAAESIGNNSFSYTNISNLDTTTWKLSTLPYNFNNCPELRTVLLTGSITSISNSFNNCPLLEEVNLHENLTDISNAFRTCPLITEVTLPKNLIHISGAFSDGSLQKIHYMCSNVEDNGFRVYMFKNINELTFSNDVISIPDLFCSGSVTELVIPNSVTTVGSSAFGFSLLKHLSLGENLTTFPSWHTFTGGTNTIESLNYNCINCSMDYDKRLLIKTITIGDKVEVIPRNLCYSAKITELIIPNSVITINEYAFAFCSELSNLVLGDNLQIIGLEAFRESPLTNLNIPQSVNSIATRSFHQCPLETITVSDNNSTYDSRDNCNAIIETQTNKLILGCKNTTIPDSVTSIGACALCQFGENQDITLSSNITNIDALAFLSSPVRSVTILGNIDKLKSGRFYYSDPLMGTFLGCSNLTHVTLPSSLTELQINTFTNCTNLQTITFNGTKLQWMNITKDPKWHVNVPTSCKIDCTDGTIDINS